MSPGAAVRTWADQADKAFLMGYLSGLETAAVMIEGRIGAEAPAAPARWAAALRAVKASRLAGFVARGALRATDERFTGAAYLSAGPGRR